MNDIEIARLACKEIKRAAKEGRAVIVNVQCEDTTKGFTIAGDNKSNMLTLLGMCESLKHSIIERATKETQE